MDDELTVAQETALDQFLEHFQPEGDGVPMLFTTHELERIMADHLPSMEGVDVFDFLNKNGFKTKVKEEPSIALCWEVWLSSDAA